MKNFTREWFRKYGAEHEWPAPPGGYGSALIWYGIAVALCVFVLLVVLGLPG